MTPPASIDQSSPNTTQVIGAPLEIATTVFQQPCITSNYIELPPATSSGIQQVYENNLSPLVQPQSLQSKQDSINISYLQTPTQIASKDIIHTTSSSEVYVTTGSDVVSSTKWINSSAADNSSTFSDISSHPSSPSAQLSPSPPESPNSSHASSGGSPQLVISESKPVSPSIPSFQISPVSDTDTDNNKQIQSNPQNFSNNITVPNVLRPTPGSAMKETRQEPTVGNGHKVVIQLQNHQLQELKNQLNLFVISNAKKVGISNGTSSNVNIKEVDSTTDIELDENRFTDITNSDNLSETESLQNKNSKLLSVVKPSSSKVKSDLEALKHSNNVLLRIEDEIQDEITPNSPPSCQAISMPLNVRMKQEAAKGGQIVKSNSKGNNEIGIVSSIQKMEPLRTCQVGGVSSLMSIRAPSFMHRLGKRPSSLNQCLMSASPSPKLPKIGTKDQPVAITASCNSNVVALNDSYDISNRGNIIVGQSAITTSFISTIPNGKTKNIHNSNGNIFQIVDPETVKRSNTYNNRPAKLCTKVSATKSSQMVVLRSSPRVLPPRMRKVIGISPPRGPAAIAPLLIPSNNSTNSNVVTDNLVYML